MEKRGPVGAIINHNGVLEYYDHLAPLSIALSLPIAIADSPNASCYLEKYYPDVEWFNLGYDEISPHALVERFDFLIFSSHLEVESSYFERAERELGKRMCKIFSPHGFSDKLYYWRRYLPKDLLFVYGERMFTLYEEMGRALPKERCIVTGNYRRDYYLRHRRAQQQLAEEELFSRFSRDQPTLFYAPTWPDEGEQSTFFSSVEKIVEALPATCNLLVKAHPRIVEECTLSYYSIVSRFSQQENVLFVEEFPLIYPLIDRCSAYLGDLSSVGYDFLSSGKPLYFIEAKEGSESLSLFQCGTLVKEGEIGEIFAQMAKGEGGEEQLRKRGRELYEATFESGISFEMIKATFYSKLDEWMARSKEVCK